MLWVPSAKPSAVYPAKPTIDTARSPHGPAQRPCRCPCIFMDEERRSAAQASAILATCNLLELNSQLQTPSPGPGPGQKVSLVNWTGMSIPGFAEPLLAPNLPVLYFQLFAPLLAKLHAASGTWTHSD